MARSRRRRALVTLLVAVAAGAGVGAVPTHADSLYVSAGYAFGGLAATDAKVFLAATDANLISVYDVGGGAHGAITNEPGVTGLAVSADGTALYAARPAAHVIDVFDTSTLARTRSVTAGSTFCPVTLAVSGQRLWFGQACADGTGGVEYAGIGTADLTTTPATVTSQVVRLGGPPRIAVAPGRVFASEGMGTDTLDAYNATGAVLHRTQHIAWPVAIRDIAVSATDVIVPRSQSYARFRIADLAPDGSLPGTGYPNAVAVVGTGPVAVGSSFGTPDVSIYRQPANPVTSYEYDEPDGVPTVQDAGLAYSPDGAHLYVVTGSISAGRIPLALHAYDTATWSTRHRSTVTLDLPARALEGALTPSGVRLSQPDGTPISDARVVVTATQGTSSFGGAIDTDVDGVADLRVLLRNLNRLGPWTITATYAGDPVYRASNTVTGSVRLGAYAGIGLSHPGQVTPGTTVAINVGGLPFDATNRHVSLYATPEGSARTLVFAGDIAPGSQLTGYYLVTVNTLLEVVYAGDAEYAPNLITSQIVVDG